MFFVQLGENGVAFGLGLVRSADVGDVRTGGGGAPVIIEDDGEDLGPEMGLTAES